MKNIYEFNETMRLLGYQYTYNVVNSSGAEDKIKDILMAYKGNYCKFDLALDCFMLGYICGKRAERARRKKH